MIEKTNIPGLLVIDLTVHGDNRGWFKENWQRKKMVAHGLPDFQPVQNNISFNAVRGVTRGIHAEPWDKYISVASGSVFGAWVDLRPGGSFGQVFTTTIDSSKAIFVPRGVGNSFQAIEDNTVYTYLVNQHWSAELRNRYTFVNLADPTLAIEWPIPLSECELSDADRKHPFLDAVVPMAAKRILVTGATGQLGNAVKAFAEKNRFVERCDFFDSAGFDIACEEAYEKIDWTEYEVVINCAAYTVVDRAELPEEIAQCWRVNATGPALLARHCAANRITLVHISSDYVFDGTQKDHRELESFSPLGVYGASKAAGDIAVAGYSNSYILRTSWVVGDGRNFVRIMADRSDLAAQTGGETITSVVDDQYGRLTFTSELVRAIFHLLNSNAEYGTYNVSCAGPVVSWYEVARQVFEIRNGNSSAVVPISTKEYFAKATIPVALRPKESGFSLSKLQATGFVPRNWEELLAEYMTEL